MSDDLLHAIKCDDVERLAELEDRWGSTFFQNNCYSISFALSEGSLNAAEYLTSVSIETYI